MCVCVSLVCKSILGEFLNSVSCMGMKVGLGKDGKRRILFYHMPYGYILCVNHFRDIISFNPSEICVLSPLFQILSSGTDNSMQARSSRPLLFSFHQHVFFFTVCKRLYRLKYFYFL